MSSPIHNGDKLGALELYAPPWVREQTPPSAPFRPQLALPQGLPAQALQQPVSQQSTELSPSMVPHAAVPPELQAGLEVPKPEVSRAEGPSMAAAMDVAAMRPKVDAPYSSASLWPDVLESPQTIPEFEPARAVRQESASLSDRLVQKPQPKMPKGVGGPNLDWRALRAGVPSSPAVHQPPPARQPPVAYRLPVALEAPAAYQRPAVYQPSEGGRHARALRNRLSLEPDAIPTPPIPQRQKSLMPLLGRLGLLTVFAATVAYAITFYSIPETRLASIPPDNGIQDPNTVGAADSSHVEVPTVKQVRMRMAVEGRQAFANEPVPLGVSLIGTPGGEVALLSGLVAGTKLSVGTALSDTSWRLPARDLSTAVAHAPKDYVGVMNAAIDLRTSNDAILDRNVVRLEWVDKQPDIRTGGLQQGLTVQSIGKDEIETLLRRGAEYMKGGDIAAARLVLQRAAGSGNPDAALALGATYDPYVFGELGVLGFVADAVQARFWYEQAGKFGAREATQRLDRLMKLGR